MKNSLFRYLALLLCLVSFSARAMITGTTNVCVAATYTFTTTAAPGGVWSSSNANATVSPAGIVTGISAGTAMISYVVGMTTETLTITVGPNPITGAQTVCAGSATTLSNISNGVSWTSGNTAVATIGSASGLVNGISPGTAVITYLATSGCRAFSTITVNETPASISGPSTVCQGATATMTSSPAGGIWTSSNVLIATVGSSSGVVTGVAGGNIANISYTLAGGCRKVTAVTVASPPPINFIPATTLCIGSGVAYTSTVTGTWGSSDPSIVAVTSGGVATGVATGTATVSFTQTSTGCFRTIAVTVNGAVTAPVTIPSPICTGRSVSLGSGSWTSSNTTVAAVVSNTLQANAAGTANITYATSAGCYNIQTITVNQTPSITGTLNVCPGLTRALSVSPGGGIWSSSNTLIAPVGSSNGIVTGVAPGSVTISYSLSGCMTTRFPFTVFIEPGHISLSPNGPTVNSVEICAGSSISVWPTVTGISFTSSNQDVMQTTSSTDPTQTGSGVLLGISAGTATLTYTATTANGSCIRTFPVTVVASTDAGTITGPDEVCSGASITLANSVAGGTWSSSNTAKGTVSAGGVVTGIAPGTTTISYAATNACGNAVTTKDITINDCCNVDTQYISTGYDAGYDTTITGLNQDRAFAPKDPKWKLSYLSADAIHLIDSQGYTRVQINDSVAVIDTDLSLHYGYRTWNVLEGSNWITTQNSHGYYTYDEGKICEMTFSRSFTTSATDDIVIDLHFLSDNAVKEVYIDATSILATPQDEQDALNFTVPASLITTVNLTSGLHKLRVKVTNWDVPGKKNLYNPTGLDLYGKIYSATGLHSILSEKAACVIHRYPEDERTGGNNMAVPAAGSLSLFPNPNDGNLTLVGTLAGMNGTQQAGMDILDMTGRTVFKDVCTVENGYINKHISLGSYLPDGVYILRVITGKSSQVIRFSVSK